jgi:hypothetical protein
VPKRSGSVSGTGLYEVIQYIIIIIIIIGMRVAPPGQGAIVEVRFADRVWCRGHLVKRIQAVAPPSWRVRFDDGASETLDAFQHIKKKPWLFIFASKKCISVIALLARFFSCPPSELYSSLFPARCHSMYLSYEAPSQDPNTTFVRFLYVTLSSTVSKGQSTNWLCVVDYFFAVRNQRHKKC